MLGVAAATALPSEVWPFKKIFLPSAVSRIDILDLNYWGKAKYTDVLAVELENFIGSIPDLLYRPTPFYDLMKSRELVLATDLSRAKYPGRLGRNLLNARATPENVMEMIDDLENLSKHES